MKLRSTSYHQDRKFTDYVHQHIALPQVYSALGWEPFRLSNSEKEELDIRHGIDRVFSAENGKLVTVQERFRTSRYASYQDVTFRYRRDQHTDETRRYSEFYKIEADYLLYGILDLPSKQISHLHHATFRKVVLLQLAPLWQKLKTGEAVIDEARRGSCQWKNNQLIIPVNHNRDKSSSFIPWDIPLIAQYWPQVVIYQKGFLA